MMKVSEAMTLPEALAAPAGKMSTFGFSVPAGEGMAYWEDADGVQWWTVLVDGVLHRQRFEEAH